MTRLRGDRFAAVLAVLLFWAGVFGAGALVDGYSAREDYISSLASRGSPVAVLGICALLANAAAHLITARAVLKTGNTRLLASFLLAAGVATAVVALFRASCPDGPAGCGLTETSTGDWIDLVHGVSVGIYELFTLAAMLTIGIGALRRTSRWPRWLGPVSVAFAIGSVLLIGQTEGDQIGLWQRSWLANNLAWLLVVAWVSTVRDRAVTSP